MSTTVDEKVLEMKFDNVEFEKNVQTSLSTIDKLKQRLNFTGASKGLENVADAAKKVDLSGVSGAVETISNKFSAMKVIGITALANITNSAVNAGKRIASALTIDPVKSGFQEYETQINAVQTILANTQGGQVKVSKEAIASINETAEASLIATVNANSSALENLKETHEKEIDESKKLADEELEILEESHETALEEYEKLADEEVDVLEDKYDREYEALEKAIDDELTSLKTAHQEKLDLYKEEYLEKLKVIDEERYEKIKAIDDQIDTINGLTKAEEEAIKQAKQNAKLSELENAVNSATTIEERTKAEEKLAAYKSELARDQLLKEREAQIEKLKASKDAINEEYELAAEKIREEYEDNKTQENELYELNVANVKAEQVEKENAIKASYESEKELLKQRQEEEEKALLKQQKDEKKAIQEQQEAKKEALLEQQDAEIAALNKRHEVAIANIESEKKARINALSEVNGEVTKGSTLEDVNRALDELNEYADKTIYNFTEMTRNIGTFTAAGIDLETSVKSIKGIANLAAVSGSTSQQASTAMYQLSQALASGTVKLMDWNSVVNAGMGGQVFQDALKETARVHGIEIDAMIAEEGSFRETLQKGWLTSEVLTETLEKFTLTTDGLTEAQIAENREMLKNKGYTDEQIENIFKLGQTATDAATKVKTFTQLFDTLKEAAQSGWTQTWEIIIGDFEGAKELLTEISDVFGGIIGASADARNTLLQGWKDGGGREDLIESFRNLFKGISSIVTPVKEAFREIFPPTTVEQLVGFTEGLKELTAHLTLSETQSENLKSTFKGLFAILDIGKEALSALWGVIKPLVGGTGDLMDNILGVTGAMGEWLVGLRDGIKESDLFAKTLQNVGDAFKVFAEFVSVFTDINGIAESFAEGGVFQVISDKLSEVVCFIFDFIGALSGKDLSSAKDTVVNVIQTIGEKLKVVKDYLNAATDYVKSFIIAAKDSFETPGFEKFHEFLGTFHFRMDQISETASTCGDTVKKALLGIAEAINWKTITSGMQGFLKVFKSLWNGIKTIAGAISKTLGTLASGFAEAFGNADFDKAFDLINGGLFAAILLGIKKFINSLSNTFEGVNGIIKNVKGILDSVRGCFEAYQNNLKAKTLMTIAGAIAVLTAAIVVLSLIDSEKLNESLGAITVLFADLVGSLAIFSRMSGNMKGVTKAVVAMTGISVAVLILASALKKVASLEVNELVVGLVGVAGLTAIVIAAAKAMSSNTKTIMKGATSLVVFSVAIKILASVCKNLSTLSWEEMAKGLVGVGVLMAEVSVFLKTAKFGGKAISTATGMVVMAAAIKILASACEDFGEMSWEEIGKGLVSIGVLLGEIVAFTNLTGNAKHVISTGTAMVLLGAAMKIFASAIEDFSNMQWDELARGLVGMAGALTAVTIAVNLMPKNMVGIGVGLIAVSTSLTILASALGKMGGMSWDEIAKGLVALGGSMGILAIGLNLMKGTISGSAAMLVAASALAVLTPVLAILGAMSWESIAKGLITIAGAFTIIGVAGLALTPIVPAILALGGAFALVGVGVVGIGVGLMAAGAGLTALAAGFLALAGIGTAGATAIVAAITIIITGVADVIPVVVSKLGEAVIEFCKVIKDGAPVIGEAFKTTLLTLVDVIVECVPAIADGLLKLVSEVLASLAKYTPQIASSLFDILIGILHSVAEKLPDLIVAAVEVIGAFFEGVVDALRGIDVDTLIKGIVGVGLLSALMVALSAVSSLIPGAMTGVAGMGAVIAELALVLAAIGGLAQIPGISWLIEEGGQFLETIGVAIGQFIGGIVGGFMSGVSSQFPQIGTDLSNFMTNLGPFIEGAKKIDSAAMEGVKSLAETILILTAANILDGLTSWFTGGSSITSFGQELATFGPYFNDYYESIKGIDGTVVEASSNAAKALAEMADNLPNQGGVVGWFAGENSLSTFADELVKFGPALKKYADSVDGLDSDVVVNSANAAKALSELASNLPNQGGVVGWFTGDNTLANFADELVKFGPALKEYGNSVDGLNGDIIVNSANAAKALSELASNLPSQGGVVSWFTGDNTLSVFGNELSKFGPSLKSYADSISGMDANVVSNSANAALALANLANNLPNSGGLISLFTGDNDLGDFGASLVKFGECFGQYAKYIKDVDSNVVMSTANAASSLVELSKKLPEDKLFKNETTLDEFGDDLAEFGEYLYDFYAWIKDINETKLSTATREVGNIIDLALRMNNLDTNGMSSFGDALVEMAEYGIKDFVSAFTNSTETIRTTAYNVLATFISAIETKKIDVTNIFGEVANEAVKSMDSKQQSVYDSTVNLVGKMVEGIEDYDYKPTNAFKNIITDCFNAIKDKYKDFADAGLNVVYKFYSSAKYEARNATTTFTDIIGICKKVFENSYRKFTTIGSTVIKKFVESANLSLDANMPILISKANGYYNDFKTAGSYLVEGFVAGISENIESASEEAGKMASAAVDAAKTVLDEHSPSKVFYKIGDFAGVAFVNALSKYESKAGEAGGDMASSAVNGLSNAVSLIAEYVNSDIDCQPTIRPVLDLSNIESGTSRLNAMFSRTQAVAISASINDKSNGETIQNGVNNPNGNTYQFTQNNYSPKALSRVEIYRQTKNQFSAMERMVEA